MYIHIGNDYLIKTDEIVGIFDIENTTVTSNTKIFLNKTAVRGDAISVSDEIPRSFVVCRGGMVYITPISPATLVKRIEHSRRCTERL